MSKLVQILDKVMVSQKIKRLSWEIYERNIEYKDIILVGISNRGFTFADKLKKNIEDISNIKVVLAHLDLDKDNPYNKDVSIDITSELYSNKVVLLCDDVLNSGKTLMYAVRNFLNTPLEKLSTIVLVDRNHNTYPIKADYVGLSLATTLKEYVNVRLTGDNQGVYLS